MDSNPPSRLNDPARVAAVRDTGLLDTPAEEVFDRLTTLAARLLHAPMALVTLVEPDRQFFKSSVGLPEPWASRRETPLSHSFCQHAVNTARPLVVESARDHPLVRQSAAIDEMGVESYAGVPLVTEAGEPVGAFCVIDSKPRAWTEEELSVLSGLARSALIEIQLRSLLRRVGEERAEQLSAERRRALAELSLGLRHEINNALTSILLHADMLAAPGAAEADRASGAEVIQNEALRIRGVLKRLEDVEALETRRYATGETMIDLSGEDVRPAGR